MKNILSWLGREEEESIIRDAEKHVEETYKTISFFADAVKAFINNDISAKAVAIENVRESEHQADILKAKMVNQLAEGLLNPPDREDLLHFIRTLDKIADWTLSSARLLGYIESRLPQAILMNMASAAELIVTSVSRLKEAIISFIKGDMQKAIRDCQDVDRLEHEADERKKSLIESIIHDKLDPTALLLSFHLAEYMEGVTDKIEDAADFIKTMAIKSK